MTSYSLVVTVADDGGTGNSVTVPIRVTITAVNEGPPVFAGPYDVDISEDAAIGLSVDDVTATDVDGDVHPHGNRFYSIISGDTNNQFSINPDTGRVTVATNLDRETDSVYHLTIQVS